MSDCYAIACQRCRVSLWVGQQGGNCDFYVYTTEPETTNLSNFLKTHRGEDHPLIFDNSQEFIYGYNEIDFELPLHSCGVCHDHEDDCHVAAGSVVGRLYAFTSKMTRLPDPDDC